MTRTLSALVLGLGLVGGLLAQSASAQGYAYSTQNRDGSRTMYGRYGYSTVPASALYDHTACRDGSSRTGYGNSRSGNAYGYGYDRGYDYNRGYEYGRYQYPSSNGNRWNSTAYDPYWGSSRMSYSTTLPRYRSGYDDYRYDRMNPSQRSYDRCYPNY